MKIYGMLNCKRGKRMKTTNRVFFVSEKEAVNNGFRPCGHCLNVLYKQWKHESIKWVLFTSVFYKEEKRMCIIQYKEGTFGNDNEGLYIYV